MVQQNVASRRDRTCAVRAIWITNSGSSRGLPNPLSPYSYATSLVIADICAVDAHAFVRAGPRAAGLCRHAEEQQCIDQGKPRWQESILEDHLKPAAERAGIGKIGWHTFRHTYSTMLRSLGVDVKVQQELLRHADIRTTLNIYTQARFRMRSGKPTAKSCVWFCRPPSKAKRPLLAASRLLGADAP